MVGAINAKNVSTEVCNVIGEKSTFVPPLRKVHRSELRMSNVAEVTGFNIHNLTELNWNKVCRSPEAASLKIVIWKNNETMG